jgi:hypothetical protein
MRRKNRKWVALAGVVYLGLMWAAYRWSVAQRPADGNILDHIQREEVRKYKDRTAKEAEERAAALHLPTGETRLAAAGPAYVAVRYDRTHVVFVVASDTESRFSDATVRRVADHPARVPAADRDYAPLAGLQELYLPSDQATPYFPAIMQNTKAGEPWLLDIAPGKTIPVMIERPVVAPAGCSVGLGFLAAIPAEKQAEFDAVKSNYFAVRCTAVGSAEPPVKSAIGEIAGWKPNAAQRQQIVQQLELRMRQELAAIDSRLRGNLGSPGQMANDLPIGNAHPRAKEWLHADQGLLRGEGALDFDAHAYRVSPDGVARLLVRARWKLVESPVFLMAAWFRLEAATDAQAGEKPVLVSADASWSLGMREGDAPSSLGEKLDFQTVLNEFDADHDGWAEMIVHSEDAHSDSGNSTTLGLYLYSDAGLVQLKQPLQRDWQPPQNCVDDEDDPQ